MKIDCIPCRKDVIIRAILAELMNLNDYRILVSYATILITRFSCEACLMASITFLILKNFKFLGCELLTITTTFDLFVDRIWSDRRRDKFVKLTTNYFEPISQKHSVQLVDAFQVHSFLDGYCVLVKQLAFQVY